MGMTSKTRTGIVAAAAAGTLALAALAGTAVANAAGSSTNPSPSASANPGHSQDQGTGQSAGRPQQRPVEEALTGDTATKVKAAVEATYPGATIERMEKDADGQSVYEAHITKADGTRVTVMLDADFAITGEAIGGPGGRAGDGGRHGKGGRHLDAPGADGTAGATASTGTANAA